MAKTDFKSVDQYIATFPAETQAALNKVRATLRSAVPDAEEVISYQMPAYKWNGWVFYLSASTKHVALACPPPFTAFETFKHELAPYELSKSTVKFPLDKPMPVKLITAMAQFRAKQNAEHAAKSSAKKPAKQK